MYPTPSDSKVKIIQAEERLIQALNLLERLSATEETLPARIAESELFSETRKHILINIECAMVEYNSVNVAFDKAFLGEDDK